MPEQRGAQQQAGDDFARYPRLAAAPEQQVHQARGTDHNDQLDEDGEQERLGLLLPRHGHSHHRGFRPVWDRAASGRSSVWDMTADLWLIVVSPFIGGSRIRVKFCLVGGG